MKLCSNTIRIRGFRRIVIDIDSSLILREVEIAEKSYEGFRGFKPLMQIKSSILLFLYLRHHLIRTAVIDTLEAVFLRFKKSFEHSNDNTGNHVVKLPL